MPYVFQDLGVFDGGDTVVDTGRRAGRGAGRGAAFASPAGPRPDQYNAFYAGGPGARDASGIRGPGASAGHASSDITHEDRCVARPGPGLQTRGDWSEDAEDNDSYDGRGLGLGARKKSSQRAGPDDRGEKGRTEEAVPPGKVLAEAHAKAQMQAWVLMLRRVGQKLACLVNYVLCLARLLVAPLNVLQFINLWL